MNRSLKVAGSLLCWVSIALFLLSLALPALVFADDPPLPGYAVLALGWWGLLTLNPAWYANPTYGLALARFGKQDHRGSLVLCFLAIGLGLTSLFTKEWWFNEGNPTPILRLGPAFYAWMGSFLALLIANVLRRADREQATARQEAAQPAHPTTEPGPAARRSWGRHGPVARRSPGNSANGPVCSRSR